MALSGPLAASIEWACNRWQVAVVIFRAKERVRRLSERSEWPILAGNSLGMTDSGDKKDNKRDFFYFFLLLYNSDTFFPPLQRARLLGQGAFICLSQGAQKPVMARVLHRKIKAHQPALLCLCVSRPGTGLLGAALAPLQDAHMS